MQQESRYFGQQQRSLGYEAQGGRGKHEMEESGDIQTTMKRKQPSSSSSLSSATTSAGKIVFQRRTKQRSNVGIENNASSVVPIILLDSDPEEEEEEQELESGTVIQSIQKEGEGEGDEEERRPTTTMSSSCIYCTKRVEQAVKLPCGDLSCRSCVPKQTATTTSTAADVNVCPSCRAPFTWTQIERIYF